MAKRLSQKGWTEIKAEMSIAGDPEKVVAEGDKILEMLAHNLNMKNIPTIENAQYMLQRVIAELKIWEKMERNRQHPK